MPFQNTLISLLYSAGKCDHFSFMPANPEKIVVFFENECEYFQGSGNGLSTVFVLVTVHLMPFQNILIPPPLPAEKYVIILL